jgi:hypothetical protein
MSIMDIDHAHEPDHDAEELLRRALLDSQASAAVAVRVGGLSLCDALTIIFHGRRDLGTIQTYVAHGGHGAGATVGAGELLRVPCDLDLAAAADRGDAEALYVEQAEALRDALLAADTVLSVWLGPLAEVAGREVCVDHAIELSTPLPAHRLMPVALVAPERKLTVAPVCGVRTLAEGRPPMGIACAQQDLSRVYPLPEDPEHCLHDFLEHSAQHARRLAGRLAQQEASVERFLELSDEST